MKDDHCSEKPTERFTGLAQSYSRWRPGYPVEAIDYITSRCHLGPSSTVVDVGCGTGISSRLLAERGLPVIGIEPNKAMRQEAIKASLELVDANLQLTYQEGRAEDTRLPDGVCQAVLAAQSFHWFDMGRALTEFHRILKKDGWIILMWNERDDSDPFTSTYGQILEIRNFVEATNAFLQSELFQDKTSVYFPNSQTLDEVGFLGRAFSVSYAPQEGPQAERLKGDLKDLFKQYEKNGFVTLRYQTSVDTAKRKDLS